MLWDEPKIFFLERRYFFSIILSEFLKNRVALQKYYPKYRSGEKSYTTLREFLEWIPRQGNQLSLLHPYDHEKLMAGIEAYKKRHI